MERGLNQLRFAEKGKFKREIAVTDEKIDEIVYELYGIMNAERKLIERV